MNNDMNLELEDVLNAQDIESPDIKRIEDLQSSMGNLKREIAKVIVGQEAAVNDVLMAILAKGHCLVIGVPGLAKTLLVKTVASVLDLTFNRIQFTPDLMPSDITGTEIIEEDVTTGRRTFKFVKGPVFSNIILADEINRTPPKTQAALLQAMQEYNVTVSGTTYNLPEPFFVLATQNPIEQEGTYPLPEAQLDRFMFDIHMTYPSEAEEINIAKTTTSDSKIILKTILTAEEIIDLQAIVRKIPIAEHIARYAVKIARATRPENVSSPDFVKKWVSWGAGPRAVQYLILGAKAKAVLEGTYNVTCEHIKSVAPLVLRHRIIPNFHAEAEGVDSMRITLKLLESVKEPEGADYL